MSDTDLRLSLALALIAVIYLAVLDRIDWWLAWKEARDAARKRRAREEADGPAPDLPPEY